MLCLLLDRCTLRDPFAAAALVFVQWNKEYIWQIFSGVFVAQCACSEKCSEASVTN
jgi:hypothetical protein